MQKNSGLSSSLTIKGKVFYSALINYKKETGQLYRSHSLDIKAFHHIHIKKN